MKNGYPLKSASTLFTPVRADHARYEQRKNQWSLANPNATPAQFELAMRGIAKLCGV